MEGVQKVIGSVSAGVKSAASSSSVEALRNRGEGAASTLSSSDQSDLLLTRPSRPLIPLSCTKLCAICFVAGVLVGYSLKRRVKQWAMKILRRLKDD